MIFLRSKNFEHFAWGVLNGWHEARTKEPVCYQPRGKTTPEQRQAYIQGWKFGREHHTRPYINYGCLRGVDTLKETLQDEMIVTVIAA